MGGRNNRYTFVNPYNFIPLGKESPSAKEESGQKYTGVIIYNLRTVTPLFIPNTSSEDAFKMSKKYADHKSFDFFSYRDLSGLEYSVEKELPKPVIPGSEMRGMLRNNYEILTNSCMSSMGDETLLSKRTQEKFKAGLLERCIIKKNGKEEVKYCLIKVKDDCLLRTEGANNLTDKKGCWEAKPGVKGREEWGYQCYIQNSLPEGTRVAFKYERRDRGKPLALNVKRAGGKATGCSIGYILKGEAGPEMKDCTTGLPLKQNKHCAHVFRQPDSKDKQVVRVNGKENFGQDYLNGILDAVLKLYEKNKKEAYGEYKEKYEEFKKGNGNQFFPVYYSTLYYGGNQEECLMLSPACITREIYTRMLSDMVGDKKSCEKSGKLCPACALFGTFREGKENVTSRIRVTDLECLELDSRKCFETAPVTLQTLSQPKFNPEFYMKKPAEDAVFWTYEYYVDSKGRVHRNMAGVNGRKFYWHHADFKMRNCTAGPDKMNKTIRPLKKNIIFEGKIYFHDLSERELNTLCYLVNAGDDEALDEKKHGYKLGAAKPLGFGSVAMHIRDVQLRRIVQTEEGAIALKEIPYQPDKENTLVDPQVVKNFQTMSDFELLRNENVSYPRIRPGDDIFGWFSENHKGYFKDKQTGENKFPRPPQSRNTMLFDQYLKPMTPKTVSNELRKKLSINN